MQGAPSLQHTWPAIDKHTVVVHGKGIDDGSWKKLCALAERRRSEKGGVSVQGAALAKENASLGAEKLSATQLDVERKKKEEEIRKILEA